MTPTAGRTLETLRADARSCLDTAIAAVDPERLVREYLSVRPSRPGTTPDRRGAIHVLAIGKGAAAMARGAVAALGDASSGGRAMPGVVIQPPHAGSPPEGFSVFEGGHPLPNEQGVQGARAALDLAAGLEAEDHLLCLISGGGSALGTLPAEGLSLEAVQETTGALLRAGATIDELNAVRKHLDGIKGGRLARAVSPASMTVLILSDVIGDPLDVISSGPASPDPTTYGDAIAVLDRYGCRSDLPGDVVRHLEAGVRGEVPESPKPGDPCFERVDPIILGNNRIAAEAALAEAVRRGYADSRLLGTEVQGEARQVGSQFVQEFARGAAPACRVMAGETTVTVTGTGRGGRNQELALGAALALDGIDGVVVASIGTDGIDGPTDAAGAIVDGRTLQRARELGLDADATLADNDAYTFFRALDDLILTGPTGTNVMDVQILLADATR